MDAPHNDLHDARGSQESEARMLELVLKLLLRDARRIARRLSALDAQTPPGGPQEQPQTKE